MAATLHSPWPWLSYGLKHYINEANSAWKLTIVVQGFLSKMLMSFSWEWCDKLQVPYAVLRSTAISRISISGVRKLLEDVICWD